MTRFSHTVLCDWGGSRLRAYLQVGSKVVARCEGPGIGALPTSPLATLQQTLEPWRVEPGFTQIVACGMVGSRNGIAEAPYVPAPVGWKEWTARALSHAAKDIPLIIAAGISGPNFSGVTDVMRGEETQIFGAISVERRLATGRHTLLLPGTHSKWVQIEEGQISAVQTYVTGEMFALFRDHSSLLRAGDATEMQSDGFVAGLQRSRQSTLAGSLFGTRIAQLIEARSKTWASEFLSGLLIGDEIVSALRTHLPSSVILIGDSALCARYDHALSVMGLPATVLDGDTCAVTGLQLLAASLGPVH